MDSTKPCTWQVRHTVATVAVVALAALPGCWKGDATPPARSIASYASPEAFLSEGTKLYSQNNEELVIRHFFNDRRDGFFVDVGAYHWQNSSTTYYLEKHLGWTGLAIDALDMFREGYEENRPGSTFFNYIVTDHSGTVESFFVAGPISSTDEHWFGQFPKVEGTPGRITVATITLNELLRQTGVTKVDFMSMDIEGGELAALRGFDIDRYRPELLCIEAAKQTRAELLAYFTKHGYERVDRYLKHDGVNWYFRPTPPASPSK